MNGVQVGLGNMLRWPGEGVDQWKDQQGTDHVLRVSQRIAT